jgi:hypothetical protein
MKSVIILESLFDTFEDLTTEQVGEFVLQLNRWRKGEEVKFDDPLLQGLWFGVKFQYEEMKLKYENKCETNKQNGKKGGRPKKTEENSINPNGFSITQPNPKNLKEKEKEKDKEKDSDNVLSRLVNKFDSPDYALNKITKNWILLSESEKYNALEKADDYLQWEMSKGNRFFNLMYYLQDKKWEWDLTIKNKRNNIKQNKQEILL